MLRKDVYPYEYMDDWEKLDETLLFEKEDFYSHLNMKDITDADDAHTKRVCKDFEISTIRSISWFVCSKQYLIVSWCIWEFWKYVSWNIWTRSCSFCYCNRFSIANSFKKDQSKIRSFNWYWYVINVRKGIRVEIYHSVYQYANVKDKYMKDYDKDKELSYLIYWDVNNLYGWAMSQKLPVNNFEWVEDNSQSNEDFIKNYNEESDEGYFLEIDVQYPEKLHFYLKEWQLKKSKSL